MNTRKPIVHVFTVVDGRTEELLNVVEIKNFDLAKFQLQFDVDPLTDPEMRDRYSVGPDDVGFLEEVLRKQLDCNFSSFAYFIEAATKE